MVRKAAIPETKKKSLFDSSTVTEEKEGFYTKDGRKIASTKKVAKKTTTTPARKKQIGTDYPDLRMVSCTLYPRHQDKLDELLELAKAKAREEGRREPGRSDLIRKAIEKLTDKDAENLTK